MAEIIRTRDAQLYGLTRAKLRGKSWRTPSHGLRAGAGRPESLVARCEEHLAVLPPGSAFSHLTGARLHRLWLPRVPEWLPVQATLPPKAIRPERQRLWIARTRARLVRPDHLDGLPVVPLPKLIGQLAEDLELIDLVVAIDCAMHEHHVRLEDLVEAIRPRQRGGPRLRAALSLSDGRSESAWESILRLVYQLCGFTRIRPQQVIRDARDAIVARADLALLGTNRISEYDGADHRGREQHQSDLRREKALSRLGIERYGYTKSEIVDQPATIARDAEAAFGMPHNPSRLANWHYEFERSTLSYSGWNRYLRRLHRFTGAGGRQPRVRSTPQLREPG